MSLEHSPARAETDASGPDRLIGEKECRQITSLSRASRWRLERQDLFPARRRISPNRVAWLLSEILTWISEREAIQ